MAETVAVVLAAGMGTRMKSDLPKVLLPALGRPMIEYVLDALAAAGVEKVIVVVGYRAEDVERTLVGRKNVLFFWAEATAGVRPPEERQPAARVLLDRLPRHPQSGRKARRSPARPAAVRGLEH